MKGLLALKIAAISLAGVLLAAALSYYNFIVPEDNTISLPLYSTVPNFTLNVYEGEGLSGKYSLQDSFDEGKIVILNFWETTCNPCIHELPYFNRLKQKYSEEVDIIAIHGINFETFDNVQAFINDPQKHPADHPDIDSSDWKTYDITFAHDAVVIEYEDQELSTYKAFGGKNAYPVTAIINAHGMFAYSWTGSMQTFKQLEDAFLKVKNNQ